MMASLVYYLCVPLGYVYIFYRYERTVHVQWHLSIEDTIGTQLAVLYREVYLIQR